MGRAREYAFFNYIYKFEEETSIDRRAKTIFHESYKGTSIENRLSNNEARRSLFFESYGGNMLTINILCVGKIKESYLKDAISEYSKRLSKYCNLNIIQVADEKVPDKLSDVVIQNIKSIEAKKMLEQFKKDTYVIALDLKGKEYTSEEFSRKIDDIALNFNSSITFIIGGTLGIGKEVLDISKEKICFSKMTFPHQLIRVFLLEQIFRAFKISNGETYHR